jgi:hypothetical protein
MDRRRSSRCRRIVAEKECKMVNWSWKGLPVQTGAKLGRGINGLLRAAFSIGVAMFAATALADPPIINGGEAPQIGRARVYDQTGTPVYTYRILASRPY